ncbi:uncharacterized protein VTP21DRAFT_7063 [Calcarisporiella thermophila]|uniref:uncharacterized protein n=1 Tax=Calcarisporiella thermophila TaxID=911321 RepID=UPI003742DEA1
MDLTSMPPKSSTRDHSTASKSEPQQTQKPSRKRRGRKKKQPQPLEEHVNNLTHSTSKETATPMAVELNQAPGDSSEGTLIHKIFANRGPNKRRIKVKLADDMNISVDEDLSEDDADFVFNGLPDEDELSDVDSHSSQSEDEANKVYKEDDEEKYSPQKIAEWLAEWKDKDPEVCCVCTENSTSDNNVFVYCDNPRCEVLVHQQCYGITKVPGPDEPWYCDRCKAQPGELVSCVLCPNTHGAFRKLVDEDPSQGWVHIVCALWMPGSSFHDRERLDSISLKGVPAKRWGLTCSICADPEKARVGACLQCDAGGCRKSFHVSCAEAYSLTEVIEDTPEMSDPYFVYCKQHGGAGGGDHKLNGWEKWVRKRDKFLAEVEAYHSHRRANALKAKFENLEIIDMTGVGFLEFWESQYVKVSREMEESISKKRRAVVALSAQVNDLTDQANKIRKNTSNDIASKLEQARRERETLELQMAELRLCLKRCFSMIDLYNPQTLRFQPGIPHSDDPVGDFRKLPPNSRWNANAYDIIRSIKLAETPSEIAKVNAKEYSPMQPAAIQIQPEISPPGLYSGSNSTSNTKMRQTKRKVGRPRLDSRDSPQQKPARKKSRLMRAQTPPLFSPSSGLSNVSAATSQSAMSASTLQPQANPTSTVSALATQEGERLADQSINQNPGASVKSQQPSHGPVYTNSAVSSTEHNAGGWRQPTVSNLLMTSPYQSFDPYSHESPYDTHTGSYGTHASTSESTELNPSNSTNVHVAQRPMSLPARVSSPRTIKPFTSPDVTHSQEQPCQSSFGRFSPDQRASCPPPPSHSLTWSPVALRDIQQNSETQSGSGYSSEPLPPMPPPTRGVFHPVITQSQHTPSSQHYAWPSPKIPPPFSPDIHSDRRRSLNQISAQSSHESVAMSPQTEMENNILPPIQSNGGQVEPSMQLISSRPDTHLHSNSQQSDNMVGSSLPSTTQPLLIQAASPRQSAYKSNNNSSTEYYTSPEYNAQQADSSSVQMGNSLQAEDNERNKLPAETVYKRGTGEKSKRKYNNQSIGHEPGQMRDNSSLDILEYKPERKSKLATNDLSDGGSNKSAPTAVNEPTHKTNLAETSSAKTSGSPVPLASNRNDQPGVIGPQPHIAEGANIMINNTPPHSSSISVSFKQKTSPGLHGIPGSSCFQLENYVPPPPKIKKKDQSSMRVLLPAPSQSDSATSNIPATHNPAVHTFNATLNKGTTVISNGLISGEEVSERAQVQELSKFRADSPANERDRAVNVSNSPVPQSSGITASTLIPFKEEHKKPLNEDAHQENTSTPTPRRKVGRPRKHPIAPVAGSGEGDDRNETKLRVNRHSSRQPASSPVDNSTPSPTTARSLVPKICDLCHQPHSQPRPQEEIASLSPTAAKIDPDHIVTCAECGRSFHYGCIWPPMGSLPKKGYTWRCGDCESDARARVQYKEAERNLLQVAKKPHAVGSSVDVNEGASISNLISDMSDESRRLRRKSNISYKDQL